MQYLISHGASGGLGCFTADAPHSLRRGQRVVIETRRGLELGVVLRPATAAQARLLPAEATGRLLRPASTDDEHGAARLAATGQRLFDDARRLCANLNLPLEILDVEVLFDGRQAILQHVSASECDYGPLVEELGRRYGLQVFLENLAAPASEAEEDAGGCGKPDCGRAEGGGGGCSTCTSGGCSSCGTGRADLRAYFAHLRGKMEEQHSRRPLL